MKNAQEEVSLQDIFAQLYPKLDVLNKALHTSHLFTDMMKRTPKRGDYIVYYGHRSLTYGRFIYAENYSMSIVKLNNDQGLKVKLYTAEFLIIPEELVPSVLKNGLRTNKKYQEWFGA